MTVLIRCVGYASGLPCPWENQYLKEYNPNAPADASGAFISGDWTPDPEQAMRFPSPSEAFQCWQQQRTAGPVRADGKANRPLTAFSVQIVTLEYAVANKHRRGPFGG